MTRLILIVLVAAFVLPGGCGSKEQPWPTIEFDAGPNTVAAMARANNEFGLDLFKELYDTTARRNVLVSPTSIAAALTMLWNGARGTTRDSLAEVLRIMGFDTARVNPAAAALLANILSETDRVQLEIASSAWVDEGYKVYPGYRQVLIDYFNAEFFQRDLEHPDAVAAVNRWVANKTHGMIKKLIDRIPSETVLCLLNAVYFDGRWTDSFDRKRTGPGRFKLAGGAEVEHQFMSRSGEYQTIALAHFKAVRIPYGTGRFAMYIFLPGVPVEYVAHLKREMRSRGIPKDVVEDSIPKDTLLPRQQLADFVAGLSADSLQSWAQQISEALSGPSTGIRIPKFRIECAHSLQDALERLGVGIIFDPHRADLGGMAPGGLWVDTVLHKSVIDVDESGTKAAAATLVGARGISVMSFSADRPFLYMIRDDHTGAILFIGTLVDPRGSRS